MGKSLYLAYYYDFRAWSDHRLFFHLALSPMLAFKRLVNVVVMVFLLLALLFLLMPASRDLMMSSVGLG